MPYSGLPITLVGSGFVQGVSGGLARADHVHDISGGGGGGAPTNATYVTLTLDGTLTNERTLAGQASVVTITDSGANAAVTVGIATNGIGNTQLRQGAATSVVGRSANSTGNLADIAASADGQVLQRTAGALAFGTFTPANNSVTDAALRDSGPLSVIGRSANSSGDPADISAGAASDAVLRESGGVLGFGTIVAGGIASNAVITVKILDANVTLAKLADLATQRVIGRNTAGTGVPEVVTTTNILDWMLTTRGDISVRGATNTARLALGAVDTFLGSDGTDLVYRTVTAAGGMNQAQVLARVSVGV